MRIHTGSARPVLPGRRRFLQCSGAALGAASLGLGFNRAVAGGAAPNPTLVYLFLEGAMDGLSLVVPRGSGANANYYRSRRSVLRINDDNGNNGPLLPLNGDFGLHPYCSGLHGLFGNNVDTRLRQKLAVVLAAGHPQGTHTRSHFDAQEQCELGAPGDATGGHAGWLARYLQHTPAVPGAVFSAMVSGSNPPASLGGWHSVATLDSADSFHPNTGIYDRTHLASLRALYAGSGSLDLAAKATLDAVDLVQGLDDYDPIPGANYPNSGLAEDLQLVAQLIKLGLGVQVATLARGGWDDHNNQSVFGTYGNRVRDLSDSLAAFFRDLALDPVHNYSRDVVVVVQSEFGRQVTENANAGTDHGLGNPMLVLGGDITGGIYGEMPSLSSTAPTYGDSVLPTMDFRRVLASAAEHLGFQDIDQLFPPAFTGDNFLTQYGSQGALGFA